MRIFLSYSRRDKERVERLHADLTALGHQVWRDNSLRGGDEWWAEICNEIAECDLFVFAASAASLASAYCRCEVEYASALDRPMLPVMFGKPPMETGPDALRNLHGPTYDIDDRAGVLVLVNSLQNVEIGVPRPEPRPDPPPTPFTVPPDLVERIAAATTQFEQEKLVSELRELWAVSSDLTVELVRALSRQDLASTVRRDVEELLAEYVDGADSSRLPAENFVNIVMDQVRNRRQVTPIVGLGLLDPLVGTRSELVRTLAEQNGFPLASHLRVDLPQVAQFLAVNEAYDTATRRVRELLAERLRSQLAGKGGDAAADLDALFAAAWDARDASVPDIYELLAKLPSPVYVTADPSQLLEHVLRSAGRRPRTEVCEWKRVAREQPSAETTDADDDDMDVDSLLVWPPSNFGPGSSYKPTVEEPLVFHVFGLYAWPDTIVLTEDDYFRFLMKVYHEREWRIPPVVRRALARSALFILGFRLDDWDFRAIWQALVNQEGRSPSAALADVAVQVELRDAPLQPIDARRYLDKYFTKQVRQLSLFWGPAAAIAEAAAEAPMAAVP